MATLNDKLGAIMRDRHVMGCDGLATYHHIQTIKDAMRKRDRYQRFMAIKTALKNYRVMVNFTADDKSRIFCPETKTELIL